MPKITTVLSPAWTTDWMTEDGKAKLKAYGIAPPAGEAGAPRAVRRGAGGLPALRLGRYRAHLGIRLDRLQGALSLPRLRRAVRLFQVHLRRMAVAFHRLTVADVRRETPDAVSIAFAVPPELARRLSLSSRPASHAARDATAPAKSAAPTRSAAASTTANCASRSRRSRAVCSRLRHERSEARRRDRCDDAAGPLRRRARSLRRARNYLADRRRLRHHAGHVADPRTMLAREPKAGSR